MHQSMSSISRAAICATTVVLLKGRESRCRMVVHASSVYAEDLIHIG